MFAFLLVISMFSLVSAEKKINFRISSEDFSDFIEKGDKLIISLGLDGLRILDSREVLIEVSPNNILDNNYKKISFSPIRYIYYWTSRKRKTSYTAIGSGEITITFTVLKNGEVDPDFESVSQKIKILEPGTIPSNGKYIKIGSIQSTGGAPIMVGDKIKIPVTLHIPSNLANYVYFTRKVFITSSDNQIAEPINSDILLGGVGVAKIKTGYFTFKAEKVGTVDFEIKIFGGSNFKKLDKQYGDNGVITIPDIEIVETETSGDSNPDDKVASRGGVTPSGGGGNPPGDGGGGSNEERCTAYMQQYHNDGEFTCHTFSFNVDTSTVEENGKTYVCNLGYCGDPLNNEWCCSGGNNVRCCKEISGGEGSDGGTGDGEQTTNRQTRMGRITDLLVRVEKITEKANELNNYLNDNQLNGLISELTENVINPLNIIRNNLNNYKTILESRGQ